MVGRKKSLESYAQSAVSDHRKSIYSGGDSPATLFAPFGALHESSTGREDDVNLVGVGPIAIGREGRRVWKEARHSAALQVSGCDWTIRNSFRAFQLYPLWGYRPHDFLFMQG